MTTKSYSITLLLLCAIGAARAQSSLSGGAGQTSSSDSQCLLGGVGNCGPASDNGTNQQQEQYNGSMPNLSSMQLGRNARRIDRTLIGNTSVNPEAVGASSMRPVPPITTKSDFQIFAEDTAGQTLQVYGRDLFDEGPSTFAVLDHVPVPSSYVIGPDDEVHVEIWGKIDADITVQVDRNGQIFIPRIGSLGVAGLRYEQLEAYIQSAVAKNFKDFELNVTLGKLRSIQIYVLGSARQPGVYTVSSLSTLIDALFVSGGPSASGSMRSIELRRDGKVVATLDLYDVVRRGDKSHDVRLLPDDVIYIAPVGTQVAIIGNVNAPNIYELRDNLSVAAALENAGGLTVMASTGRALVERIENHKMRQVEAIKLDQVGMHRKLSDGDVLRIEPISPEFAGTVMLRGSVAVPGRYPWYQGMRISDLIPNREALITRDHWIQLNRQIEFQENRIAERQQGALIEAQLTNQATTNSSIAAAVSSTVQAANGVAQTAALTPAPTPGINVPDPAETSLTALYGTSALPTQTQESQTAMAIATSQTAIRNRSTSSGLRDNPATEDDLSPSYRRLDLLGNLKATDAQINWNYAVIERLDKKDLSARLIPFNLGEAISNSSSESNQVIEQGDIITIFSIHDIRVPAEMRSAFVEIQGEVGAPGVYRINSGETLRDLVKRAGGLTRNSYLYGLQLTRPSTRILQQQQLAESIQRMQQDLASAYVGSGTTAPVAGAGAAASAVAEATGEKQAFEMQQNMISRLLTVQPTGRIVLGIKPTDSTLDDIPELLMDDGDMVTVARRMDTVAVLGEVYNQSALRYRPGRRLSDYLNDTGGPTRTADASRIYLIRADGTVIEKRMQSHHWNKSFQSIVLMPGDALVVPPKVRLPGGAMDRLMEVTGILPQAAIMGAVLSLAM